ncbi:hypothetical protein FJTKL_03225 [Diaporthe vaccinii]|uniref:Uncharacterized protein n=1 Tax=Diaporthe vaccinii TaxID=105482 RepID=A0ABR4DVK4_9PEZI
MMVPFTPQVTPCDLQLATYIPTMGWLMEPWTRYPCLASGTGTTTNSGSTKSTSSSLQWLPTMDASEYQSREIPRRPGIKNSYHPV